MSDPIVPVAKVKTPRVPKVPPPKLDRPKEIVIADKPAGSVEWKDKPLSIRYVTGMDWQALIVNIISAGIVFLLMAIPIHRATSNPWLVIAFPLAVVWIVIVINLSRLWTTVEARKAKVYLDNVFRQLTVYLKGFHFVAWYASQEPDEVDFQKHEVLDASIMSGGEKKRVTFPSRDGLDVALDLKVMFQRRDSEEALSKSLKYQLPELREWVWATVISNLTNLGGINSYESLLYYKSEVIAWIASIFGGEGFLSPFELDTGTAIKNPIAEKVEPTDESKEVFAVQAKINAIANAIEDLVDNAHVDPKEAATIAQTIGGAATRTIHTYEGIPKDAKYVSVGGEGGGLGFAAASKEGKKK